MNGRYRGQQHFGQGKPCTCTSLVSTGASLSSSLAKLQPAYTDLKVLQYGEILVWFEASSTDVFPANVLGSKHGKTSRKRAWHGVYITSVEVTSCNFDSGIHQVWTNLCGLLAGVLLHFLCVENLTLRAVDFLVVAVLRQWLCAHPLRKHPRGEIDWIYWFFNVTGFRQNRSQLRLPRSIVSSITTSMTRLSIARSKELP